MFDDTYLMLVQYTRNVSFFFYQFFFFFKIFLQRFWKSIGFCTIGTHVGFATFSDFVIFFHFFFGDFFALCHFSSTFSLVLYKKQLSFRQCSQLPE